MDKKMINKEEIIAEYLTGNISYRALEKKYGVPSRSICDWVLKYQGRLPNWREKEKRRKEKATGKQEVELSNEVKVRSREYKAPDIRRTWIDKGAGKKRPLGIGITMNFVNILFI